CNMVETPSLAISWDRHRKGCKPQRRCRRCECAGSPRLESQTWSANPSNFVCLRSLLSISACTIRHRSPTRKRGRLTSPSLARRAPMLLIFARLFSVVHQLHREPPGHLQGVGPVVVVTDGEVAQLLNEERGSG